MMRKKADIYMKEINVIALSIRQGFRNLRRNRMFTLASVGTVAACLFLFGLFYFALANFRNIIQGAENSVGISVFFVEGASGGTIQSIGDAIRQRPEVDHADYISAEEAWEEFKEENFKDSPELVDSFSEDNPLADSASYEVYLKDVEKQDELVDYLETIAGVREVKRSAEVAENLSSAGKLAGIASFVLIFVLLLVSVFLIYSTIATGITVRKPEIALMRLMGASDYFIWSPFVVEGVIIGLVGSGIPLMVLAVLYGRIIEYVEHRFSIFAQGLSFLTTGQVLAVLVPVSLLTGVGIGLTGSFINVRKNLNI